MDDTPCSCPKKLAEVIRMGQYDPDKVQSMTTEAMREMCKAVEIEVSPSATKVYRRNKKCTCMYMELKVLC